jgi:hypothetical protein
VSQPARRKTARPVRKLATSGRPKKSFLVITEGERTEVQYLNYWRQQCRDRITVEFDEVHGRSPLPLVRRAVKRKRDAERTAKREGAAFDEVWCVFDRDDFDDVQDAIRMAHDNGVRVAFWNPCFEIWFVWHFENCERSSHRHDIQARSAELLNCEKSLNRQTLVLMEASYWEARERAQHLEKRHAGNGVLIPDNNPSTDAWKLVEALRKG